MPLKVFCGSAWRSSTSAAETAAAPASPAQGPPTTAQARTEAAVQETGRVGAPCAMRAAVSTQPVLSTAATATATSAATSQDFHRSRRA